MAVYKNSQQTEVGHLLENRIRNGEGVMEFTCIQVGAGIYTDEEKRRIDRAENLKEVRQVFSFSGITPEKENDYLLLESVITNDGLETGYYLSELGIFARVAGSTEEVLYCIGLVDQPDYIPPQTNGKYKIMLQSLIKCCNTENVVIQYDEKTYATAESLIGHTSNKENPHQTDKEQVGLGHVDNTSDIEKPVSTAQQEAIDGVYQQATGYTDQKIADLINGAPSTLDTLGEIAAAMGENKDVVQALETAIGTKANQVEMESLLGTKLDKTGNSKDNTITFESGDSSNPTGWTDVGLIASGEKHSSLLRKISLFVKNVRYLWKLLGTTSLAGIGDGTVTGAISALNTGLAGICITKKVFNTNGFEIAGNISTIVEFTFTSPAGYKPAGIIGIIPSYPLTTWITQYCLYSEDSKIRYCIRSIYGDPLIDYSEFTILFIRIV